MSQARNTFFYSNDFFFLWSTRLFEWALHAQRKHYYYYTFLQKKHYLENIISTRTELYFISDHSETCSPNLTDPDATNTNWMSGFNLLCHFAFLLLTTTFWVSSGTLTFSPLVFVDQLRLTLSLAPKTGRWPKPGKSECRITLSIMTGLEIAPWLNPEQGCGWDYGEVAL